MAILSFSGVTQSYGDFDVFVGASGNIPQGGKVGIVGPNGVGKTTLLRVLAGVEEKSAGGIHFAKGTRIGYLRQEAVQAFAGRENSVWQEMLTVFAKLRDQEQRLKTLETQMAEGELDDEMFAEYSRLQTDFEMSGGYDYEIRIKSVLSGLGFQKDQFELPLKVLSGGQKTRALLARLLLENPDLLILDEPTNHLDIAAVEWLEGALKVWDGAVLIVSHDRYFLDRVVDTIWELSRSGIEAFRGNYSHYVTQRVERWAQRQADYDMLIAKFLKELDYIKRNIARDSTKDQAVGRLKRLIREVKMMQLGGSDALTGMSWAKASALYEISGAKWEVPDVESAIKSLPRPANEWSAMKLTLHAGRRSGNLVLRTYDLAVGYSGNALFKSEDIELRRLEVAALIGPNGAGKTSFLKTLLEEIPPVAGEMKPGASLDLAYFAQAHDRLDHSKTVLDELMDHSGMLIPEGRNYLGRFLFSGEDVYKPIHLLSGGERGRLALALLAFEKGNFLVMDEPTNHLDIPAQEALQEAMEKFDGTILMVSHDRYLIDRLATQIWEVKDGRLRVYGEGYQEYLGIREREREAAKAERMVNGKLPMANGKVAGSSNVGGGTKGRSKNQQRKMERQLEKMEAQVMAQEEEIERLGEAMQVAAESADFTKIQSASDALAAGEAELERLMEAWETLAAEVTDGA